MGRWYYVGEALACPDTRKVTSQKKHGGALHWTFWLTKRKPCQSQPLSADRQLSGCQRIDVSISKGSPFPLNQVHRPPP